jgi:serine/threonine protein kinase
MEKLINKTIAKRYRCVEKIGSGGMGVVYLALDTVLNRKVVLKVLQPAFKDEKNMSRFFREAKILSRLNHPHIVTIHDFGMWKKNMYIVLEYLEGRNLHQIIKESGPLSVTWLMNALPQMMDALEAAHQKGIIHRDLKPSNIFCLKQVDQTDYIKVLDFGTAISLDQDILDNITPTGEVIGSPSYMSPEQIMGKEISPRSDIYALGINMYEILSGEPPFRSDNMMSILLSHLYKPPKPINSLKGKNEPQIQNLLEIMNTCLNKNPEDRYGSIHELRKALTETPKSNFRLPENLVGERQMRFKQYYLGPVEDTSIETSISRITPAPDTPLLVIEAESLPIESTITPLLRITNHTVQSPISLDWNKMKKMKLPEAIILNIGKDENLKLIQEIQRIREWRTIPVLICGPEGDLDYISRAIDAGAGDYLSYPFDPKEIIKKIESLNKKGTASPAYRHRS